MSQPKLSIHDAAAALLKELDAPPGSVVTMVDIDEKRGDVIRVLVAQGNRHIATRVPTEFMGYPVILGRQPKVYALGA